jgi:hypothetical protein
MIRTNLVRAVQLGGILLTSTAVFSCGSNPSEDSFLRSRTNPEREREMIGSVSLKLELGAGVTVNSLDYSISGNGYSKSGTASVEGPGMAFMLLVDTVPVGTGYTIKLDGKSVAGDVNCGGSAMFDVVAGQATHVTINLTCDGGGSDAGGVLVDGKVDASGKGGCPVIDSVTLVPVSVAVGASVKFSAVAKDADGAPSPITYAWSAASGTFGSSTAAATTFTCAQAGTVEVQLAVSDGACTTDLLETLKVTCTEGTAGTGGAGAGGAGTGGSGEGGAGTGGAGTGGSGEGGAGTGGAGTGGSGEGGAGTGGAGTGGAGTGGDDACVTCELADPICQPRVDECYFSSDTTAAGGSRQDLCADLVDCVRSSKCASGPTGTDACLCGSVSTETCLAGTFEQTTGPCRTQIAAASESATIVDISQRFVDPTYAVGRAFRLIACDKAKCADTCDF